MFQQSHITLPEAARAVVESAMGSALAALKHDTCTGRPWGRKVRRQRPSSAPATRPKVKSSMTAFIAEKRKNAASRKAKGGSVIAHERKEWEEITPDMVKRATKSAGWRPKRDAGPCRMHPAKKAGLTVLQEIEYKKHVGKSFKLFGGDKQMKRIVLLSREDEAPIANAGGTTVDCAVALKHQVENSGGLGHEFGAHAVASYLQEQNGCVFLKQDREAPQWHGRRVFSKQVVRRLLETSRVPLYVPHAITVQLVDAWSLSRATSISTLLLPFLDTLVPKTQSSSADGGLNSAVCKRFLSQLLRHDPQRVVLVFEEERVLVGSKIEARFTYQAAKEKSYQEYRTGEVTAVHQMKVGVFSISHLIQFALCFCVLRVRVYVRV